MKPRTSHENGLLAESVAALILRLKGYAILEHRYKTPVGEIDLIARRGKTIAFVEVKARKGLNDALACVTPQMQIRITRAAEHFLARNPAYAGWTLRFDLMALAPPFYWRHLDNAWQARP